MALRTRPDGTPPSLLRTRQQRQLRSTRPELRSRRKAVAAPSGLGHEDEQPRKKKLPRAALFFLLALIVPWIIKLGDVRLSLYRIVLLATLVPTLIMWASGKAGKIRTADIAILMYSVWCAVSLFAVHGPQAAAQPSAIAFIETTGAYFLARCYIRDADDFYNMSLLLFRIFAFALPFAIFEAVTYHNLILEAFSLVMPSFADSFYDPRWGLRRVQAFAEHPILFGICAGSIFSLVHLVLGYGKSFLQRLPRTGAALMTAFLSLSAGPMLAVASQAVLIGWDRILQKNKWRWKIALIAVAVFNACIAIIPNQSLPGFYIEHFTFDESAAFFRVLIWRFGSASVLNHPLFGVGNGEWDRPEWMPPSIDMFWLIHAVRYGLLGGFFMLLAFFANVITVGAKKGLSHKLQEYRTAYLLCMTGYFIAGWTVHYWNATYVLFLFMLGSGVWLLDADESEPVRHNERPQRGARTAKGSERTAFRKSFAAEEDQI